MTSDQMDDKTRRAANYQNAVLLAQSGVAIFPTVDKVPMVRAFTHLDDEIPPGEKEAIRKDALARHGAEPVHIGATRRLSTVRKLWHRFPDATPSIAPGPNGLIVIDPDRKNDGPKQFAEFCKANGGLPESAVCIPTRDGGQHWYFKNPEKLGCQAGSLKALGCDVKGATGQVVAPGSIREDGKTYGTKEDLLRFVHAYKAGSLPELPSFVREAIGASSAAPLSDSDPTVKAAIECLRAVDWPDFDAVFDPTLGRYDLQALALDNMEFAELYRAPSDDRSHNRFLAARHLMREWPDMPVEDLAAFFSEWEGAGDLVDGAPSSGEFNNRQIAREWVKNQGLSKPSTGAAFGTVVDDDEAGEEKSNSKADRLAKRFSYIEDIRNAALRLLDWCVKHFIARGTTSIASGQWGAGKTAVFSDIALHVAHGFEWRGRKVRKGVVVYVALENPEDVERRVRAWCASMEAAGFDVSGGAFVIHRGPCCLYDPNNKSTRDERDLIEIANKAAEHYGLPVSMVVLDTLSQSIAPGNDREHGGIYTASMQRIATATGANVTALHHPTKAGDQVRGDGAFQGNVDTIIVISRDRAGHGTVEAGSKFRIGNPAKVRFDYRLKSHVIGRDEDGEDIEVVLAVEPERGAALGAVDDTDEDAALSAPDTPADKLRATLRALEQCATEQADATGDAVNEVGVTKGQVFARLNRDRKAAGLPVLKDPTIATRLLDKLVKSGEAVRTGENRRTEYRLAE